MSNEWFWAELDASPMKCLYIQKQNGQRLYGYKGEDAEEVLSRKTIPAGAVFETRGIPMNAFIIVTKGEK